MKKKKKRKLIARQKNFKQQQYLADGFWFVGNLTKRQVMKIQNISLICIMFFILLTVCNEVQMSLNP